MNSTQDTTELDGFLGLGTGRLPAAVFIIMAIVFGLPGNSISLYIFLFRMEKKSTYVIFVSFLAMFDVLTCAVHMPLELIDLMFPLYFTEWLCKFFRFNNGVLFMGSLMTLLVIAVVRYRHVVHPLKEKMSQTTAKRCCWAILVWSNISSIPTWVFNGNHTITNGNSTATICYIADEVQTTIFPTICFGFYGMLYCMSVITLSFTYMLIGKTIRKTNKKRNKMKQQPMKSAIKENSRQKIWHTYRASKYRVTEETVTGVGKTSKFNNRKTKVLFLITFIFIVAYLPFVSLGVVLTLRKKFRENLSDAEEALYRIAMRFPLINNVANPVVYGFYDQAFKRHLTALFHRSH